MNENPAEKTSIADHQHMLNFEIQVSPFQQRKKIKTAERSIQPRGSQDNIHNRRQTSKTMTYNLVVLQEDEAEVELAEGQLQVFDVAMFVALFVG